MTASMARHETRALLRAHLAAASGYRHLTRHCAVCYRLLRLAMESTTAPQPSYAPGEPGSASEAPGARENSTQTPGRGGGEAPGKSGTAPAQTGEDGDESPHVR